MSLESPSACSDYLSNLSRNYAFSPSVKTGKGVAKASPSAIFACEAMQMCSVPIRTPSWFSTRKLFEQKLSDLHKCTDLNQVKQIHAQILKSNLHLDLYVVPKLISAFSLSRQMPLATNTFNQVQYPNVHLYNTMIRAHTHNSQPSQAFATFFAMQCDGFYPDNFTFPFLLKACTGNAWLPVVQMVHAQIEKFGFMSDVFVPNSLIDSYSKCGSCGISAAKKLFVSMGACRDVVSWNSMISGFAKGGLYEEARKVFDEMPERDGISWNTMLDGYVKVGKMDDAFKLFDEMPERNVVSWSTMVLGYCKAGDMEMARMLFDKMPVKNLVSWTIIISGFAEKGLAREAIGLFDQMEKARLKLDNGTVIGILAACAESGLLGLGERIHASIKNNNLKCTTEISNALVDMYAKCGRLNIAYNVFNDIKNKDVVSWNAMLQGLAMHGHGVKALELFKRMKEEGFSPDKVTMIGVLCACTHAGLIDDGIQYFSTMERDYTLVPEVEHYGCMVDLLGRKGRLEEAVRLIRSMPMEPNVIIWGTLLGACRMHNAVELAREVLDHLVKLEPSDSGNLSMLSNIYAAAGDWDCVADTRLRMRSIGTQKPSGASSIEVDNEVHEFTVFDRSHPKSDNIYQVINGLRGELKQVLMERLGKDDIHDCTIKLRVNPQKQRDKVYIGCGAGFGGDRPTAALKLLQRVKTLNYLVLECLAERTLADRCQVMLSGGDGYDSRNWMKLLLPLAIKRNICIITNMGAMDPPGAQRNVIEIADSLGLNVSVAVAYEVSVKEPGISTYMGAAPIVECLEKYHPNVIITSRVADAALFLAPMVYELGWNWDDLPRLAQGILAGHLLECGCQLTGGYFMHPGDKYRSMSFQQLLNISLPYAEVEYDGKVTVAKAEETGGLLNFSTCAEQLLYEVGDPSAYITPDMVVDFSNVSFYSISSSRVLCSGAKPSIQGVPEKLLQLAPKDCGWKGWGEISYGGCECVLRAKAAEYLVRSWMEEQLIGINQHIVSYTIGLDSLKASSNSSNSVEDIRLRMDGLFKQKEHALLFVREFTALYTNGPAGGGGISTGYKKEIVLDKQLVGRENIFWQTGVKCTEAVKFNRQPTDLRKDPAEECSSPRVTLPCPITAYAEKPCSGSFPPETGHSPFPSGQEIALYNVAHSRAGDKGNDLNFSVIPHYPSDIERLKMIITPEWVMRVLSVLHNSTLFPSSDADKKRDEGVDEHVKVEIYEVKGIHSLNVVVRNILDGGVNCSRRMDRHGKTISDLILNQQIVLPP